MENSPRKKISTVAIVPNIEKPDVPQIASDLIKWLDERGVSAVLKIDDAVRLERPDLGVDDVDIQQSDIVVCLGGDGTILRGVRLLRGAAVPLIGVNLGRVGFLSEVEFNEMYPAMDRIIAGDFVVDERMMLKCTIKAGDFCQDYLALNEIAIERGHYQRLVEIDVYINDEFFSKYTADGMIFATPTGSTAYSFSAGGPIVSPEKNLILLAPINPHSLFGRTLVLGEKDRLRIEISKRLRILIGVDGFAVYEAVLDSLEVEKADSKVLLAKLKDRSFYKLFKSKLQVWDTWMR